MTFDDWSLKKLFGLVTQQQEYTSCKKWNPFSSTKYRTLITKTAIPTINHIKTSIGRKD